MSAKPYSVTIGVDHKQGPIVFHCESVTWLNRSAGIGFVDFRYTDRAGSTWSGRTLAGPDGCGFFPVTAPTRSDRAEPHFADEAARACLDYLAQNHPC